MAMPFMFIGWSAGEITMGIVTNYIKDWRIIQLYIFAIPCLFLLIGLYFLIESARYSYISNKNKAIK
jgi:hypothetical protein